MTSGSFESIARVADGVVVRLHLTGTPAAGAELDQTSANVQQTPTFKELNESPTVNNVLVTGVLGVSVLVLAGVNCLFRNKEH